jgi:hypothetical protein
MFKDVKNIYFYCCPGMGILDIWLPVIYRLHKQYPDIKYSIIFQKPEHIDAIDFKNVLIKISECVFDQVIHKHYFGGWIKSNNYIKAKQNQDKFEFSKLYFNRISFRLDQLKLYYINLLIKFLIQQFGKLMFDEGYQPLEEVVDTDCSILLYDISESHKVYAKEMLKVFSNCKKFSLQHGVDVRCDSTIHPFQDNLNTISLLFSEKEVNYYENNYGVDTDDITVVGIPKHDQSWIDLILLKSSFLCDDEYAVLFSRSLSDYFPLDRKIIALNIIRDVVIKMYGLKLIIKLHPKERGEELFFNILGKENYNKEWEITTEHPFAIAQNAKLSITFFSSVCVDMSRLNTPQIEFLDLRRINKHDNNNSLRKNGIPVFDFRYLGLTFGASTKSDFVELIEIAIKQPNFIINEQYNIYSKFFDSRNNSIDLVCSRVTA